MQTGDTTTSYDGFSQFPQLSLANSGGGSSLQNSMGLGSLGGGSLSDSGDSGSSRQLAGLFNNQNQGMGGSSDGLFSGSGLGAGMGTDSGMGLGMGGLSGLINGGQGNGASSSSGPSPLMPMQPYRRYPQNSPFQPADMVRKPNPYESIRPSLTCTCRPLRGRRHQRDLESTFLKMGRTICSSYRWTCPPDRITSSGLGMV